MDRLERQRQKLIKSQTEDTTNYVLQGRTGIPGIMSLDAYQNQRVRLKVKSNTEQFDLLQRVLEQVPKNSPPKSWTAAVAGKSTWDEVFQVANDARISYQKNDSFLRKIGRSAGDNAHNIMEGLKLIPESEYTSPICAGLKFVFGIALHIAQHRDKILKAFDQIPEIVGRVEIMIGVYGTESSFQAATARLYDAIIVAIIRSIEWLVGMHAWKKAFSIFLKDSQRGSTVESLLEEVQFSSQRVSNMASDLEHVHLAGLSDEVEKIRYGVSSALTIMNAVRADVFEIRQQTSKMSDTLTATRSEMQRSNVEVQQGIQGVEISMESQFQKQQRILDQRFLSEGEKFKLQLKEQFDDHAQRMKLLQEDQKHEWVQEVVALLMESHRKQESAESRQVLGPQVLQSDLQVMPPVQLVTKGELFGFLNQASVDSVDDLERLANALNTFDSNRMAAAQGILMSQPFRDWLLTRQSQLLLIDGSMSMTFSSRHTTPMTAMLASLVISLWGNPSTTILSFFCGLHTDPADPLAGPSGLLRSLISQVLLRQQDYRLDFINSHEYCNALLSYHLPTLCDTFVRLVIQIPGDVICLLDGLCQYEEPVWEADLDLVLKCLAWTVGDGIYRGRCFKVLITTPSRSWQIKPYVETLPHAQILDARYMRAPDRLMSQREVMSSFADGEYTEAGFQDPRRW